MELLRSALGFFLSNADILAIILLSIAVIRLSIDSTTQEKEIKDKYKIKKYSFLIYYLSFLLRFSLPSIPDSGSL